MGLQNTIIIVIMCELICVQTSKNEFNITHYHNKNPVCENDKCIMKCCPFNKYITFRKSGKQVVRICARFNNITRSFVSLAEKVFVNYSSKSKLNFTTKSGILETTNETYIQVFGMQYRLHLTEKPELRLELPNAYNRWSSMPNNQFCWDYIVFKQNKSMKLKPGIWVVPPKSAPRTSTLITTGMFVSCVFLFIVLVVYGLIKELRNLGGKILMAYVATLLIGFLLLGFLRLDQHLPWICRPLSYGIYYSFMASFCWMNIMSYDIWWTFRGYAKTRPIHRRGENFKFKMYCLYAFGLPLAMTILVAVINDTNLRRYPWFIKPNIPLNGCFFEGGEKLLYLYVPMLILIMCNWLLYLMTAINIWRLSRGTAVLDSLAAGTPQAHRSQRQRFMVYLKLSVVMGLNWALEVVSSEYQEYNISTIIDLYNFLIGFTIFLIFVCKRKILRNLIKLYIRTKKIRRRGRLDSIKISSTRSSESSSSPETPSLQVCSSPTGSKPDNILNS